MTRKELFQLVRRIPAEKLKELFLALELDKIREDVLRNVDVMDVYRHKTTLRTQILISVMQYAIIQLLDTIMETKRRENISYILANLAATFDGAQASIRQKLEKERLNNAKKS